MFRNAQELSRKDIVDHVFLAAHVAELPEWNNSGHLDRIRRSTYILASGAGLNHSEAELVSIACLLHDIGKITLPEQLLKRTANLEPAEYKLAEQHTYAGGRILSGLGSPILQAAAKIALTHHERWDGSGYPEGLKGDETPLSGRVMAIADIFDALTTRRSYKAKIAPEAALDLLKASSGTLFDPLLVSVLAERFEELRAIVRLDDTSAGG